VVGKIFALRKINSDWFIAKETLPTDIAQKSLI